MRTLARKKAPPDRAAAVPVNNRFEYLPVEEVYLDDGDDISEGQGPTIVPESNVIAGPDKQHDLLRVEGKIQGQRAVMLIDLGSTHDFISESFVKRHGLNTIAIADKTQVPLAGGSRLASKQETKVLKWVVGDSSDGQRFRVFPLAKYDAIFGKPWLTKNNPRIDFRTNERRLKEKPVRCAPPAGQWWLAPCGISQSKVIPSREKSHGFRKGDLSCCVCIDYVAYLFTCFSTLISILTTWLLLI